MQRLLLIPLLLLTVGGSGQIPQPVPLGAVEWKITTTHAAPDTVPATAHRELMTKKIYKDETPSLVSRKIDPGTEVLSNKTFRPVNGFFTSTGKKITPFKTEIAKPLLTRDNQEFNVSYTDRQHGFIANSTFGMAEDRDHNIWIATESGVVKYDGYHYQQYNEKSGLPEAGIVNVLYDKLQRLWLATDKGVYYIRHDSIFSIESKTVDLKRVRCRNIIKDRYQRIWVCSWENGAICIDGNNISVYDTAGGLPNNDVCSVLIDSNENIFLLSGEQGITILQKDRVLRMFRHSNQMARTIFLSSVEDEEGIWIGGFSCGLINLGKKDTVQYSMFGAYNERLYDIKKANKGLWLSIYGAGLYYFGPNAHFLIGASNGLQSRLPFTLYQDSYHNIWTSDNANGFSRLNENSLFLQPFQNSIIKALGNIVTDKNKGNWIFTAGWGAQYQQGNTIIQYSKTLADGNSILAYPQEGIIASDGSVWMGSYGEGPVKAEKDYFTHYEIFRIARQRVILSVKEDRDHRIWFATLNNGLVVYDGKTFWHYSSNTGLLENKPSRLFTNADKIIFCGFGTGLQRFEDHRIETFYVGGKQFSDRVNYYYENDARTAFIGTENSGLLMIRNNIVYELSGRTGLSSNKILSIVQSRDGKLWITTDKSTEYFIINGHEVKEHHIFGQANGSYVINNSNVLLDTAGNPYWPLNGTFIDKKVVFDAAFITPASTPPYFSIDSISIDRETMGSSKQLSMLPNERLNINYSVKYWGRENYLTIQYLLITKKGDSSFRSADNKGHILISDIVPDDYRIYLTAKDDGNIFVSSPLYLEVRNFWYNTWLFRILLACFTICAIVYYYRRKGRQQVALNRILTSKVAEQTNQLRKEKEELLLSYQTIDRQNTEKGVLLQEINHRVKNNLQFMIAILDMQLRSDLPEDAKTALQSTSGRMNAMSLVHEMLYDSEDFGDISIKKYLTELVGHFKRLASAPISTTTFHLDTEDISMPMKPAISLGMIISELVNNSLKHAFTGIPDPQINIVISHAAEPGRLELVYRDNGTGITEGTGVKKGIGNRLISIFSRELDGEYSVESRGHFSFRLLFNPFKQPEEDEQS
ncbi:MAG: hypothetical protein JO301_02415 [Chitinophagaceae bacterium]|nr:hypothetical protein [Chitinophagaceae bacterium]